MSIPTAVILYLSLPLPPDAAQPLTHDCHSNTVHPHVAHAVVLLSPLSAPRLLLPFQQSRIAVLFCLSFSHDLISLLCIFSQIDPPFSRFYDLEKRKRNKQQIQGQEGSGSSNWLKPYVPRATCWKTTLKASKAFTDFQWSKCIQSCSWNLFSPHLEFLHNQTWVTGWPLP